MLVKWFSMDPGGYGANLEADISIKFQVSSFKFCYKLKA